MKTGWRHWALTILGLTTSGLDLACAQGRASGDRAVAVAPGEEGGTVVAKPVRRWRARNRYFAARPTYPPAAPGARANITFETFTRWYYPNEGTYYPPLDE